jgi:putative heme-binding domain-containing protein
MKKISTYLVSALLLASVLYACVSKSPEKKADALISYPDRIHTPEEQLAGFNLPDGFVIELVASEREGIVNPVDLTFDDAGRLWTQTARMYPLDPFADVQWTDLLKLMDDQETQRNHPAFKRVLDLFQGRTKGTDQVLVLNDFYGKGEVAKVSVWADSLTIPMSIMPYKNGVYIAQGSELFFLDDTDNDGKGDKRTPLITGFGFTDTHTMTHSLVRGPGGWMYFSHGGLNKGEVKSVTSGAKLAIHYSKIARFSMDDAKKIELVTSGLNNIWGFQLRHDGQWYATEANDLGYTTVPLEPGAGFPGIGNDRLREYQPFMPELHKFRVGGTGLSGLAFPDDKSGTFPSEWKDVAFLANPITSTINAVRVVRNADGTVSNEHLPDLLTSKDKYFRPVNIEFGPDGCLYIADWYNKIISHNEVPTSHPERDKTHGRIWRIRHVSQKPRDIVNFYEVPSSKLVGYLKSPSLWERRSALHQITDRPKQETSTLIPDLASLARDSSQDESTRVHALWCLEGLAHFDADLIGTLLASREHNVRREAVRSLVSFELSPAEVSDAVKGLIDDANPMVRSQVIRTLAELHKADASTIAILVHACKPELPGNEMGGSYERRFERFLALMALEQYPRELREFIRASDKKNIDAVKLLWAIRALPRSQMEELFPSLWAASALKDLDESNFITVAKMLDNTRIYNLMRPVLQEQRNAERYLRFAIGNERIVQSEKLSALLKRPTENLLETGTIEQKNLALDVMGRFKMKTSYAAAVALVTDSATDETINLVIKVLENEPQKNSAAFIRIAQNNKINTHLRISALHNLTKSGHESALRIIESQVQSFDDSQKKELASALSSSKEGSVMLTSLYGNKHLTTAAFDLASAERVSQTTKHPLASEILVAVKGRMEEEKKSFDAKLARYVTMVEKNPGDPDSGQKLFQTCLMCHRVGDQGQDIAPALDGSAARETEALLTALIEPDAAVERGYAVFRVTRKDNTSVEGYLRHRDGNGTTLSFMGGSEVFIPIDDIKSQYFLGGRSFMPRGLIDGYTDKQVADLAAYIATLK